MGTWQAHWNAWWNDFLMKPNLPICLRTLSEHFFFFFFFWLISRTILLGHSRPLLGSEAKTGAWKEPGWGCLNSTTPAGAEWWHKGGSDADPSCPDLLLPSCWSLARPPSSLWSTEVPYNNGRLFACFLVVFVFFLILDSPECPKHRLWEIKKPYNNVWCQHDQAVPYLASCFQ